MLARLCWRREYRKDEAHCKELGLEGVLAKDQVQNVAFRIAEECQAIGASLDAIRKATFCT